MIPHANVCDKTRNQFARQVYSPTSQLMFEEKTMQRHSVLALCAAAALTLAAPTMASARGGGHFGGGHFGGGWHGHGGGWHGGGWHGRGVGFGLGAVGLGLGLGYYGAYGSPYYAYAGDPYDGYGYGDCYLTSRRVWTSYGWRIRRVEVCN
jgi:hypothetical protein